MIRIVLPFHLQTLAACDREVAVEVDGPATTAAVLAALEARYPMLKGTIRHHITHERRPRVRFFADGTDISHNAADLPLPDAVASGQEPFMIVGAVAGG